MEVGHPRKEIDNQNRVPGGCRSSYIRSISLKEIDHGNVIKTMYNTVHKPFPRFSRFLATAPKDESKCVLLLALITGRDTISVFI